MKQLFYTIFTAIFALSMPQAGAMEMFPVGQSQVTEEAPTTSEALKQDAKRLTFFGAATAASVPLCLVVRAGGLYCNEYLHKHREEPSLFITVPLVGCAMVSALSFYGFGTAFVADSARVVGTWIPKALYPWSGLTKADRFKAVGLSALSAGSVLASYCWYKSL